MKKLLLILAVLFPLETFAQEELITPESEFALMKADLLSLPASRRSQARYMTSAFGYHAGGEKHKINAIEYRRDERGKIVGLVLDPANPNKFLTKPIAITSNELMNRIAFFGINSLSTSPAIIQPEFVEGSEHRIIRFYLDNYRIRPETWEFFVKNEPYFSHISDKDVNVSAATFKPIIRTDWFLANAFVEPSYSILLNNSLKNFNPKTETDILENFKFNLTDASDIERQYWATVSGENSFVAIQSRRLRRYSGVLDYIHITDDYKSNVDFLKVVNGKKVYVIKDPVEHLLDPEVVKTSRITKLIQGELFHGDVIYEPDGHEGIFQIPNNLQGYYISNAQGKLIAKADPELGVRDTRNTFEPVISNGKSCIWCHDRGINPPTNTIQQHLNLVLDLKAKRPEVNELIKSLYDSQYQQKIKEDSDKYCTAVGIATGLDAGDNASWFRVYVQWYDYNRITASQASRELGISEQQLEKIAKSSISFRLGSLFGSPPTPIPRRIWESLYQSANLLGDQNNKIAVPQQPSEPPPPPVQQQQPAPQPKPVVQPPAKAPPQQQQQQPLQPFRRR